MVVKEMNILQIETIDKQISEWNNLIKEAQERITELEIRKESLLVKKEKPTRERKEKLTDTGIMWFSFPTEKDHLIGIDHLNNKVIVIKPEQISKTSQVRFNEIAELNHLPLEIIGEGNIREGNVEWCKYIIWEGKKELFKKAKYEFDLK